MSKTQTYRLYIHGEPQPDYAPFTARGAKLANEVNNQPGNWQGYEWRREDRKHTRQFDVQSVNGTRQTFASFAAFNAHLEAGGLADGRRQSVEYINSQSKPVRLAA